MKTLANSVRLIGNLGMDPEIKTMEDGKKLSKMSIATSQVYKDKNGQKQTTTQWHKVAAWGKTAEITERYLKKGSKVAVEGKLTHRKYEDKKGFTRSISEVMASSIMMLGAKGSPAS